MKEQYLINQQPGLKSIICLILDRSGSMGGRETDVINGVNSFIAEQKKLPDPASIAFVRFDSEAVETFRVMGPLAYCPPLTADEYSPRGGTPLFDAVGRTISQMDKDWKEQRADRAIVVIVTDGEENASREYTKEKIKDMVNARQRTGRWAFVYLGANVDAFSEASKMGINPQNVAGYTQTAAGMNAMYSATSDTVKAMRSSGETVAHNLGKNIGEAPEETKTATTWTQP